MPEKDRYQLSPGSNVNLLKRHLTLSGLTFKSLQACFGQPNGDHSHEKIENEWVFQGKNGVIVVLYDLIHQEENHQIWHIDSLKKETALDFSKWLHTKIK
jgi:hypothetical protein